MGVIFWERRAVCATPVRDQHVHIRQRCRGGRCRGGRRPRRHRPEGARVRALLRKRARVYLNFKRRGLARGRRKSSRDDRYRKT